jgi:large subunit ribosomal protein L5
MADDKKKKGADDKKGGGDKAPKAPQKTPVGGDPGAKAKADAAAAKAKKAAAAKAAAARAENRGPEQKIPPRMRDKYKSEVIPALMKQFNFSNPMEVPRVMKITVNMGLGEAVSNAKIIEMGVEQMTAITGQKPMITRARKSIATFKLRANSPIGVMVTLRRERMWEFLDRLVSFALPRVRDFKGVSPKAFDGKGNYTLGLKEQIIFPEINYDTVEKVKGLNISITTTAKNDEEGRALLQHLGMPFRA